MQTREAHLPMSGWGSPKTEAALTIAALTPRERLRRGLMAPLIGLGIAILVLPIPVVHFMVPPLAILGGIVLGFKRAMTKEVILSAHGPCPFCGTSQTLGLNGTAYKMPRTLHCRACRKEFSIDEQ